MLCCKCKKRQAVVFLSTNIDPNAKGEGYCMTCARELGVPQIEAIIKQMGLTDEQIEEMENNVASMAENGSLPFPSFFGGMDKGMYDDDDDEDYDDLEDEETEEIDADSSEKALAPSDKENEDADSSSDESSSDDDKQESSHGGFFSNLFGSSFEPGGAAYNDSSDEKSKGRKRKPKTPKRTFLDNYCTDLTKRAKEGKLDRIIGREKEIERMIQILSRRTKNNPCLIGEPGVGKTAIVEGLALKIAAGQVPARLAGKEVHMLDLTALVAGTQFRGQFESRIKGLVDEVKKEGNIILFIDEVHNLVGTGDAEGSMNAANILKPSLSRGELQVIGATTFTEYRKHIEKDTALERRFQPVTVTESTIDDTICVLRGIKEYYENHHRVKISDALISRAVKLSERYITDRFLPDKAIDLMDEACSCAALRNKDMAEYDTLTLETKKLKNKLDSLTEDGKEPDFEKYTQLQMQIKQNEVRLSELEPLVMDFEVTEYDLAHVIELWTGINATRVQESEFKKLSTLESALKAKIKGQDEAVDLVAAAIRRSRVQISPRRRPSSFIFVGPTGVGKTELVKVLANELFDSPETLIRLDMSEFMEKHSVSKIIGSPPGYVGYDEAGQLTEKVRRKPYAVLLFDEIEKAHPDVLNILLQILDEGKITDAQGRVVNFENTVIIMTSNAGSENRESAIGFGKTQADASKEKAIGALREFLRPEFIARVDEIVVFSPLSRENFIEISRLMVDEYIPTLAERGVKLIVNDAAVELLADKSMDGQSAARDLRNLIRKEIEDPLAVMIIDRMENLPESITVDAVDGKIKLI